MGTWSLPLHVAERAVHGVQPVTVGVPFPSGMLFNAQDVELLDASGQLQPLQTQTLAQWPDASVQWLLLDFALGAGPGPAEIWELRPGTGSSSSTPSEPAQFAPLMPRVLFTNKQDRLLQPMVTQVTTELEGPVRTTTRREGRFPGRSGCAFTERRSVFSRTGLTRIDFTLHNARPAKHAGGLWDLGDAGSLLFHDLSLLFAFEGESASRVFWKPQVEQAEEELSEPALEVWQASSGGTGWQSRNHVNRWGEVKSCFQGYRVRTGTRTAQGLRAEPSVRLAGPQGTLTIALPGFWQEFPKALEADRHEIRVRLFPRQFGELFELQGGERKTHTVWLHFAPPNTPCAGILDWVYRPVHVHAAPEWYAQAGVFPGLGADRQSYARLDALLAGVLEGADSLVARRERIDEYGWRNFGDVYADHEAAYYKGPEPVISHYNNQYDVLLGTLLQQLRTGDPRWYALAAPLARHVMDIDIYHTTGDRAAYNGGMFWHTDHYRDAGTATHRAYSRVNQPPDGTPYGGGPSNEHNYTTGLLLYHYLTGDPAARAAVLGLADWVIQMDEGRTTVFGLLDDGPTGFASKTRDFDYHGPGRGAGNSINALLDGWQLGGDAAALHKAEELIRRCIHPADDVPGRDLLNVEERWSYTVFLEVLGRYLRLKAATGQLDFQYAYARASLLHYAGWMLEHEDPYFDHPEKLEYPTETWAAQDFRKAQVLRLAAEYEDEPRKTLLRHRASALADRAWTDLERFPSRTVARALAIMMTEGLQDAWYRSAPAGMAPRPTESHDFGQPQPFLAQRWRVKQQLRSPVGLLRGCLTLLNPARWWRLFRVP